MKLILIGPPGSGKGTQAELLKEKYKIPHISVGNILLDNIKKGTKLGKLAKPYYDKGKLVPLYIVSGLIKKRIKEKDCKNGFILDGYPRTIEQVKLFEKSNDIDKIILVTLPRKKVYDRISKRYMCKCGANYHLTNNPPKIKGICDKCGGKLFRREDDTIPVIKKRLDIYTKQTEPLIKYYIKKGKLIKINGDQEIKKVFKNVIKILS